MDIVRFMNYAEIDIYVLPNTVLTCMYLDHLATNRYFHLSILDN
jgi:hypothetical protein